ncbi:hypothetical protein FVR03_15150 [Pontibacter qinzhouensis]|uniref:DUF4251 domain-containing protein n=1 Tax=Pontibacter qinzhouensis TaxID=2603253 RepID=A0A5C8JGD2_9BACT|nr:hypothetical protein [Pontibacter qinzhouensis]TXK37575.1 hypothetical protein FVR03_15150 [Pontibacter qinzhouensis]
MFQFLRNSHRCTYRPSVRLLLLLFLFSSFSGACSTNSAEQEIDFKDNIADTRPDTLKTRKSATKAPVQIDFLGNPFLADYDQSRKLDAYFARINSDFTVEAEPIPNIHKTQITDTIYIIRFGSSMIELYAPTQTGDLLLQVADIQGNGISLRNNMKVGMSQPELMNKLKNFDVRILQTNAEIVATSISTDGAPAAIRFLLKNGKVSRIRYEGYVD